MAAPTLSKMDHSGAAPVGLTYQPVDKQYCRQAVEKRDLRSRLRRSRRRGLHRIVLQRPARSTAYQPIVVRRTRLFCPWVHRGSILHLSRNKNTRPASGKRLRLWGL